MVRVVREGGRDAATSARERAGGRGSGEEQERSRESREGMWSRESSLWWGQVQVEVQV